MACRLFGAKPLFEPLLPYCQLDPKEHILVKSHLNFASFHSRKCAAKCCLRNSNHFVSASVCWVRAQSRSWASNYILAVQPQTWWVHSLWDSPQTDLTLVLLVNTQGFPNFLHIPLSILMEFKCFQEFSQWPIGNRYHFDGLVQEKCNSSALAMELRHSCTNPSISLPLCRWSNPEEYGWMNPLETHNTSRTKQSTTKQCAQ